MRILLDSRDLIDLVEHQRPVTPREYEAYLRAGTHLNVLSFTNVRELSGPLATGTEFFRVRPFLQALEQLPTTYIKEVSIIGLELQAAVRAYEAQTQYAVPDVYTTRWDRVLVLPPGRMRVATDDWVNFRLDEIVRLIHRVNPEVFAPPEHHIPQLRRMLDEDRIRLQAGQAPARLHFTRTIRRHADSYRVRLPDGREDDFAEWIYRSPNICPGLRLQHETYRALMSNYGDVPEVGDFSDLAHLCALPYVEAATFDRRMRHYCGVSSKKLLRLGYATDYRTRIYENLEAIVQRNPPRAAVAP